MFSFQRYKISRLISMAVASIFFSTQLFVGVIGSGIVHAEKANPPSTESSPVTETPSSELTPTLPGTSYTPTNARQNTEVETPTPTTPTNFVSQPETSSQSDPVKEPKDTTSPSLLQSSLIEDEIIPGLEEEQVTLCRATGSETNPYEEITTSASGAFNGHLGADHQLGEDIIPPFTFNGQTYSQNWDAAGQAIYNNNCVPPVVVVDICSNIEGVQTTIPEGMVKNNAGNCVIPDEDRVTLCHATGSVLMPFVRTTISASGAFNGHLGAGHQLGEDIIPPFTFNGQTYSQNWDAAGQAIYNNDCVPVAPEEPPVIVTRSEGGRGGGAVLGASTTIGEQLVNTGSDTLGIIFAALALIGVAAATALSTPKYQFA